MKTLHRFTLLVTCALLIHPVCWAQTHSNAPQLREPGSPPTTELAKFEPFLGLYEFSGDFASHPYRGTLEIKPAVKGWYVEWIINVHSVREKDPDVDRQLRMLTTWDRLAKQYRIWRFETGTPLLMGGGDAHFNGDEFIMEWRTTAPNGTPGTFRNRVTMKTPNEFVIVSEGERDDGTIEQIGVGKGSRRL